MSTIEYKKNANETIERLKRLVAREAQDEIFASCITPSNEMINFQKNYSGNIITDYPDPNVRMEFWNRFLQERVSVEDDSIPAAYPSEFDQGLYGALFGGDVRFLSNIDGGYVSSGWISSMVPPILKDWSEFKGLKFDADHVWFQKYLKQLEIMAKSAKGKFGISHIIVIDSLNFVYELIGATDTYLSLYEEPEMVRKAIDFAFDLNLIIHNKFFDIVPAIEGGTCSWVVPWMPGRIACESADPFHMTSVETFEEWGRGPMEKLIAEYDGGALHLHANGWYLLETAVTIKGLKALLLVNEQGYEPAIDQIHGLRKKAGDTPISVMVDYPVFIEKLTKHELAGGVFYYISNVPDIDSANRCMEKVRSYRS